MSIFWFFVGGLVAYNLAALMLYNTEVTLLFSLCGALFGLLFFRQHRLHQRIQQYLKNSTTLTTDEADASPPSSCLSAEPDPLADDPIDDNNDWSTDTPQPATTAAAPPSKVALAINDYRQKIWRWFSSGNMPVKIGILILFFGVAALLKYTATSWLQWFPISVRLALIALAAMGALGFAWHLRDTRRAFSIPLQGGAIGILLLTIFTAFQFYHLIPSSFAFALLVVLVGASGLLAVLQQAQSLAVLGLFAGFAAPILVSSNNGSAVALFSYYTLLNLAIFAVAWRCAWRWLNLLGFIATFSIASVWGVLSYQPRLFAHIEPFLIINFLIYTAVPWLYLRQPAAPRERIMDASLLFGNPLIFILLQGGLLQWQPLPLAFSAVLVALLYVGAAWRMRRQPELDLLQRAWAVLAVFFATLAIPLALGSALTANIFALEGAGLIWLGWKQGRRLPRWGGLALQLLAALALYHAYSYGTSLVAHTLLISALFLALAGAISCYCYQHLNHLRLTLAFFCWGLFWWLTGWWQEAAYYLGSSTRLAAHWSLLVITATLVSLLAQRLPRQVLGKWAAWSTTLLTLATLPLILVCLLHNWQPLTGWLMAATLITAVSGWFMLAPLFPWKRQALFTQTLWWARWALIAGLAIWSALNQQQHLPGAWLAFLVLLPALLLWTLALYRCRWLAPPLVAYEQALRRWLVRVALGVFIPVFLLTLMLAGDTHPLAFIPLLNPLELLLITSLLLMFASRQTHSVPVVIMRIYPGIMGTAIALLITSITLRAVHQLSGVPWQPAALFHASIAQMSLTLIWSAFGVAAWLWGSRFRQRQIWLAGAIAMGVVLVKLLFVDRGHLGNLYGIGSFIGFGLLCTLVGYFAPVPPATSHLQEDSDGQ